MGKIGCKKRSIAASLVALSLGAACGEPSPGGPRGADAKGADRTDVGGQVEIFSWWTSGGERDALDAVIEVHKRRVPDASITNAAVEFADKAREQLERRLNRGTPPDTFQANAGASLYEWVLVNGVDDKDARVEPLDDLAQALEWEGAFAAEVLDAVSFNGRIYAVPLNVHRLNTLYYRKDLFEEFGLTIPTSVNELLTLCEEISNNDKLHEVSPTGTMSCLGLGNKWEWTLSQLTFEIIFPAIAGPEFYESYFRGEEKADAEELLKALDVALLLYCGGKPEAGCEPHSWFNPDVAAVTWDEGVRKLSERSVMMAAMGDWAKGFLESSAGGNQRAGEDFGVVAFPGSQGSFIFASDAFPLPKGAPNRDGARSLLRTFGSPEGQLAFNKKKGSIPARSDIDPSEFDAITQETIASFQTATKVRALSGLMPAKLQPKLQAELTASFERGSTEIIVNFLRANYRSF